MSHYLGYGALPTVQQKHTCEKMQGSIVTKLGPLTFKAPFCKVGSKIYSATTGKDETLMWSQLSTCSNVGGTLSRGGSASEFACSLKSKKYNVDYPGVHGWYYYDKNNNAVYVDLYKLTGTKPLAPSTAEEKSLTPIIVAATAALVGAFLLLS